MSDFRSRLPRRATSCSRTPTALPSTNTITPIAPDSDHHPRRDTPFSSPPAQAQITSLNSSSPISSSSLPKLKTLPSSFIPRATNSTASTPSTARSWIIKPGFTHYLPHSPRPRLNDTLRHTLTKRHTSTGVDQSCPPSSLRNEGQRAGAASAPPILHSPLRRRSPSLLFIPNKTTVTARKRVEVVHVEPGSLKGHASAIPELLGSSEIVGFGVEENEYDLNGDSSGSNDLDIRYKSVRNDGNPECSTVQIIPTRTKEPVSPHPLTNHSPKPNPSLNRQKYSPSSPLSNSQFHLLRHPSILPNFSPNVSIAATPYPLSDELPPMLPLSPIKEPPSVITAPFQPFPVKALHSTVKSQEEPPHTHRLSIDTSQPGVSIHRKEEGICIYCEWPGWGIVGRICAPNKESTKECDAENGNNRSAYISNCTAASQNSHNQPSLDASINSNGLDGSNNDTVSTTSSSQIKEVFLFRLVPNPIARNFHEKIRHSPNFTPKSPSCGSSSTDSCTKEMCVEPALNETFTHTAALLRTYVEPIKCTVPFTPLLRTSIKDKDTVAEKFKKRVDERILAETEDEGLVMEGLEGEGKANDLNVRLRKRWGDMRKDIIKEELQRWGMREWEGERPARWMFLPYAARRRSMGG